jgi:beta-1,4-mannosyl-glycoprotein beta-1,4-N-acetylglucosaminyltransferase
MYFAENKERYNRYLDKIIYIPVHIDANKYDWAHDQAKGFSNASWQVENCQRNAILNGLKDVPNTAVVMISDLDEIPNRDAIPRAIRMLEQRLAVSLETRQFYYNLGQCLVEPWPATVVVKKQILNHASPQQLRDTKNGNVLIKKGGWHLTYFGNVDAIRNKIMNFAHQEYNNEAFTDPSYIEQRVQNGKELYGRQFPMVRVTPREFPENFLNCFDRYLNNLRKLNFIQIGAGAGDLDPRMDNRDGFTEYVKRLDKNAINKIILVEPNPINIPNLKKCWEDYPQAEIYNIGICPTYSNERSIKFYYTDKDAPHYQVFSMDPEHVTKHYPGEKLNSVIVNCVTLQELIHQTIEEDNIELLALDIEGIDADIILDTDWKNINCNLLSFEKIHLGDKKVDVARLLLDSKYYFVGPGLDHNGYDCMYQKISL